MMQANFCANQVSTASQLGPYEYYTVATADRPCVCYMRRCTRTGVEEAVLDLNAERHAGTALGAVGDIAHLDLH